MELLMFVAIALIGYVAFNTSKVPKIAVFNATLILPLVVIGLALLASALDSSVGKILGFVGLGVVSFIFWGMFSSRKQSDEDAKNSDDS